MKDKETNEKNILAYFEVVDGKIALEIDDEKISPEDFMLIMSNVLNEYIKAVSENIKNSKQPQQN